MPGSSLSIAVIYVVTSDGNGKVLKVEIERSPATDTIVEAKDESSAGAVEVPRGSSRGAIPGGASF